MGKKRKQLRGKKKKKKKGHLISLEMEVDGFSTLRSIIHFPLSKCFVTLSRRKDFFGSVFKPIICVWDSVSIMNTSLLEEDKEDVPYVKYEGTLVKMGENEFVQIGSNFVFFYSLGPLRRGKRYVWLNNLHKISDVEDFSSNISHPFVVNGGILNTKEGKFLILLNRNVDGRKGNIENQDCGIHVIDITRDVFICTKRFSSSEMTFNSSASTIFLGSKSQPNSFFTNSIVNSSIFLFEFKNEEIKLEKRIGFNGRGFVRSMKSFFNTRFQEILVVGYWQMIHFFNAKTTQRLRRLKIQSICTSLEILGSNKLCLVGMGDWNLALIQLRPGENEEENGDDKSLKKEDEKGGKISEKHYKVIKWKRLKKAGNNADIKNLTFINQSGNSEVKLAFSVADKLCILKVTGYDFERRMSRKDRFMKKQDFMERKRFIVDKYLDVEEEKVSWVDFLTIVTGRSTQRIFKSFLVTC